MRRHAEEESRRKQIEARLRQEAQKLRDKMNSIDELINGLEHDNEEFEQEVEMLEASFEENRSNYKPPLEKLELMLQEWSAEELYTHDDLVKFATELWKSREEFEKELRATARGAELELKKIKATHERRE